MQITAWSVRAFTSNQLKTIKDLVVQLIEAGMKFEDSPLIISESGGALFTGKIAFDKNWALVKKYDETLCGA